MDRGPEIIVCENNNWSIKNRSEPKKKNLVKEGSFPMTEVVTSSKKVFPFSLRTVCWSKKPFLEKNALVPCSAGKTE